MRILLIIFAVLYTIWPNDLLLDIPGIGWIDDLLVWALVWGINKGLSRREAAKAQYQSRQEASGTSAHSWNGANPQGQKSREQKASHPQGASDAYDPYRMLGIERGASPEEIKSAYRQMASKYHPDRVAHLGDEFKALAEKRFKEIQQAYRELTSHH